MIRVLLFGRLQDIAGWREQTRAGDSLAALCAALGADARLGEALSHASVAVVVNGDMVRGDRSLSPGDEVAFLPAMSGG